MLEKCWRLSVSHDVWRYDFRDCHYYTASLFSRSTIRVASIPLKTARSVVIKGVTLRRTGRTGAGLFQLKMASSTTVGIEKTASEEKIGRTNTMPRKVKVCVIGAGAAGLCAARHLAADPNFTLQVYEQTNQIGGTWVYTEKTGLDANGLPIHSSMYRDLRTNLPGKIMNFPDHIRMIAEEPGCVTHQEVLSYLENYADHFDLRKHIQFNRKVESVQLYDHSEMEDRWIVRVMDLKMQTREELIFDSIMICNGHYFDPNLPEIRGIESFSGTVLHSHSYREPEGFDGKTIFILGAASSGIDIGIDLSKRVPRVYLSHNGERMSTLFPSNMRQVVGPERVEGRKIHLRDGTVVEADVFLFCTGYHFSYPFLHENCAIRVDENYVTPLYKHLINIEHPTMCIVGVPMIVVPFPMFHAQIQYFLAALKGGAHLPSRDVMLEDSRLKTPRKRHAHKLADTQWAYNDSLADAGAFDRIPKWYKRGYEAWFAQRKQNLVRFKEARFVVSEDGESVEVSLPRSIE